MALTTQPMYPHENVWNYLTLEQKILPNVAWDKVIKGFHDYIAANGIDNFVNTVATAFNLDANGKTQLASIINAIYNSTSEQEYFSRWIGQISFQINSNILEKVYSIVGDWRDVALTPIQPTSDTSKKEDKKNLTWLWFVGGGVVLITIMILIIIKFNKGSRRRRR